MTKRMRKIQKYTYNLCAVMILSVLCIVSSKGTYAYLSADPGTAVNEITVGEIKIQLEEENWDPQKSKDLHPLETTAKDPVIKNTGTNPAYVFMEVITPMRDFSLVSAENQKTESAVREIFTYEADRDMWQILEEKVKDSNTVRVYGYQKILQPGEATVPLFREITSVNYLEGSLDPEEIFEVKVSAKAIQEDMGGTDRSLTEIYSDLIRQTKLDQEGKEINEE